MPCSAVMQYVVAISWWASRSNQECGSSMGRRQVYVEAKAAGHALSHFI